MLPQLAQCGTHLSEALSQPDQVVRDADEIVLELLSVELRQPQVVLGPGEFGAQLVRARPTGRQLLLRVGQPLLRRLPTTAGEKWSERTPAVDGDGHRAATHRVAAMGPGCPALQQLVSMEL